MGRYYKNTFEINATCGCGLVSLHSGKGTITGFY
jgi:hypothetical protein